MIQVFHKAVVTKIIKEYIEERNFKMLAMWFNPLSQSCDLQIYKGTHTGEKPYEYRQSSEDILLYNYLQIHKRTCTGEKSSECN